MVSASATPPEGGLTPDAISHEIAALRRRRDDVHNAALAAREKLASLASRDRFVPSADLAATADEGSPEVDRLEAELEEVERLTDEAHLERATYELMVRRLREEGTTWRRELGALDRHARAKRQDADNLSHMLRDASDVRDAAQAELTNLEHEIADEIAFARSQLGERQGKVCGRNMR